MIAATLWTAAGAAGRTGGVRACEISHGALVTRQIEVTKVLTARPEAPLMEKFAGLFIAFMLACAPAFAQADTHSPATSTPNIQQWRGTLVEATCAGASATKPEDSSGSAEQTPSVDSGRPKKGQAKGESAPAGCTVTNSTSAFALQANGGQVLKFDSVGNIRAAEMLKNKTNWTKDLSAGKPIHAKVSGTLSGDTITVTSLD